MKSSIPYIARRTKSNFQIDEMAPFGNNVFPSDFQTAEGVFHYFDFDIDQEKIVIYLNEIMLSDLDYKEIREAWIIKFRR